MRIYTDLDGRFVNALSRLSSGENVDGRAYQVVVGGSHAHELRFQLGDPAKVGVNGMTTEMLLAIAEHRLRVLNEEHPHRRNTAAIACVTSARGQLEARRMERMQGVPVVLIEDDDPAVAAEPALFTPVHDEPVPA